MDHLNSNMANLFVFVDAFGFFVCLSVCLFFSVFLLIFFFREQVVLLNEKLSIWLSLVDLKNVYM